MQTEGQPQNIMQAFRLANQQVAQSKDVNEMISAYDKVVNFCAGDKSCRAEKSTKRDMLLYWAYNHIGDAYFHKGVPAAASMYWDKALAISHNDKQKAHMLEKMLNIAGNENVHMVEKCRKILAIVNQLTNIYKDKGDSADLRRITALGEKTLEILKKAEASW